MREPTHIVLTLDDYRHIGNQLLDLPYRQVAAIVRFLEANAVAYVQDAVGVAGSPVRLTRYEDVSVEPSGGEVGPSPAVE